MKLDKIHLIQRLPFQLLRPARQLFFNDRCDVFLYSGNIQRVSPFASLSKTVLLV
jgi:hypothetical protein|tara:strand:- start:33 stop:197 length:165 start_codon:yes stop_codon:yes gene_type:complete